MSAAAEGIAGLTLSAISIAALFTTCIECFDIVVTGKNFSKDYEQLLALFSLQRVRFGLWGESVGLIPMMDVVCNMIKILIDQILSQKWNEYSANALQGLEGSSSVGINIFKGSFDRFKSRIRRHQKETSAWNVTRWAIHDAKKFERVINRLEKFVDGLENITTALGLLQGQHARLREEIESISDVESLKLLRDASSSHHSSSNRFSQYNISDTASRRLIAVTESVSEQQTLSSTSNFRSTILSFVTAKTSPSIEPKSLLSQEPPLPGAWPKSIKSDSKDKIPHVTRLELPPKDAFTTSRSCEECLDERYKCITDTEQNTCTNCIQTGRTCSFQRELEGMEEFIESGPQGVLSQNQRLMTSVIKKAKPRQPLSFTAGDIHYGERSKIKNQNEHYWLNHSGKILVHADSSSSAVKRMFIELRNIRAGKVPFISAVPLNESLNKVLASIEGPPETPYEGGIFWITVKLSENDPHAPLMLRFHTKIYHPNISPQGHICADYKEKWDSSFRADVHRSPVNGQAAQWYRAKSSDAEWTLGSLLVALCGLLATPDVDDPLVPEIAQKYLEDFEGYCENARLYTQRFATGERPDESQLLFLEDIPANSPVIASDDSPAPLLSAAAEGHIGVVKLLLENGADITILSNRRWTPLHLASYNGHIEVVKLLLEKGADVTIINNRGWTPLHLASYNGYIEVVKLLLGKGADITTASNTGWTPLKSASDNGHGEVVKLLLENGADTTVINNEEYTLPGPYLDQGHPKVV
ncbi:hypothetical protein F5884DRAFT_896275 [Xylogone sp. PMI_703]|nr:hypothetical protein F5884DRAFT_896275 [Xylogone sp. PMI_703]